MHFHGTSIIGGRRSSAQGALSYSSDPRTGERLLPGYAPVSADELDLAGQLAAAAAPAFAATEPARRAHLLNDIAARLQAAEADFVAITPRETGLAEARVRAELARTCGQLRAFAAWIGDDSWRDIRIDHGDETRVPAKPEIRCQLEAIGPVAVFCASNFPLAFSVAGGDTAAALAAGCPVLVKAHSQHALTAELAATAIVDALAAAGLPAGIFSLLYGPGRSCGVALVQHPAVRAVGFTGSEAGGRALMAAAAARPEPIPVFAEMGSLNPVFIFAGAMARDADALAAALHQSITNSVGQFCTRPGLLIVQDCSQQQRFVDRLATLLAQTAPAPMLSLSGAERFRASVQQVSRQPGVRARVSGVSAAASSQPVLLHAEISALCTNAETRQEMFGPAVIVSIVPSVAAMQQLAETLSGQLTATIWAEEGDWPQLTPLLPVLRRKAGRVLFNGVPTGVEVCPAQTHGGPFPASSDSRFSAVGVNAIYRFVRPVSYQNWPEALLPPALQLSLAERLWRVVDGTRLPPTVR